MPTNVAQLLLLRFRLAQSGEFRFFHSPTVYAFLHARLGTQLSDPFPSGVRLLAVESNRIRYAAGDAYHVGLAILPESELSGGALVAKLRKQSRETRLKNTPLGPRTSLIEAIDLVSGEALRANTLRANAGGPAWLSFEAVGQQARRLAEAREVTLRFDSPLLILRRPVQRRDTFLDEESFDPKVLLVRSARAVSEQYPELVPLDVPEVELLGNRLCRAETYYRGWGDRRSTTGKILPGAIGEVQLGFARPIGFDWALRLLLAGLVGVGKSTAMGQGRFHVIGMPVHERWPPAPARTLCERMATDERLAGAREALRDAGPSAGVDDVGRDEFLESLSYRWGVLQDALRTGEHRPGPLRGLLIERTDGKLRPLAVPTLDDRFLQRACSDEVVPAIDELLEETSFAYRRGLSRRNAEYHVRQAHDAGYRHVLDADLRSFFDSVDWGLLEARLRAYFGRDPKAVQLFMRWVQAPVQFGERLVRRSQGLPQGAVLSPWLANLYLDSFDEAIQAQGFRLVRYADDFVVLCKSAAEVSRARNLVEKELARLELQLHTSKTSATSFDHGFEFLGYIFARSLALPKKPVRVECQVHHGPDEIAGLRQLNVEDAQGWLADWLHQPLAEPSNAPHFQTALVPKTPARQTVYVVEPGLRLSASRRGLRVYEGDTLLDEVAWDRIAEVAVLGNRRIAPSFFQQAMRHRIPVALYTRAGRPTGLVLPHRVRTPSRSTREHWQWSQHQEPALHVARALVEAKLRNQRLVVRHQSGDTETLRARLLQLSEQVTRAERIQRIRGLEGAAAHLYFGAWPRWLPAATRFPGRSGRGASDPVNALLNLLYTQLFHHCWMACISQGLDPFLGTLHVPSDRYPALAADLQEPFRFLCERLALNLFHRQRLTVRDFVHQEKPIPQVRLKREALKLVLGDWESRLEARVNANGRTQSYRRHIMVQAERYAELVRGERQTLSPFRLRW